MEKGKIPVEERIKRLNSILRYTINNFPIKAEVNEWPKHFWMHFFTEREMLILLQMADALVATQRMEQALVLLKKMLAYYQDSKVQLEFHYRITLLILERLSIYSGRINNSKDELMYSEMGIEISLACENKKVLATFLYNKANALVHSGDMEKSMKYYKLAFYCAELMQPSVTDMDKRSYENLMCEYDTGYIIE